MSETSGDQVRRIAARAIEIDATPDRDAYLDEACGGDDTLRAQVDAALQDSGRPSDSSDGTSSTTTIVARDARPGETIGRYKLLQQIGEGGFGVVYMAEQQRPVRRRVALKVIKLGMDTRQVIARFEAERQALAMMNHPNIARALDAGATESGRPFFVMELVPGVPITEYCDTHKLEVNERLELFRQVCNAVQHAHQKGIIHRDIKPSNVLVTLHDGAPVPKVIDFGIAKATSARLTEKTMFTEFRQFIGTPEYMSPEQAEMSGLDIDTRSDVYSLGVLLYELLTGTTPFDGPTLRGAGYGEIQRIIREQVPHRPSTRLSTMKSIEDVAKHRRVEPRKLNSIIRGDLDWIVMKALEKDRTRRYDTANGLALDVQRAMVNEPVSACPPSTVYRLRKLVRRHRGPMIAASLILLMMATAVVGTSWGLVQAIDERTRADAAADDARIKATTARRISDFMVSLFQAADPELARGTEPTASELLDLGVERLNELTGEPEAQATLRATIGSVYLELGQFDRALPLVERALEYHESQDMDDPESLVDVLHTLGALRNVMGEPEESEQLLRRALALEEEVTGPDSVDSAQLMNSLSNALWHQGRLPDAEAVQREALAIRRRLLPTAHADLAQSYHTLGSLRFIQGDLADAESLYRQSIDITRTLGNDDTPGFATTAHTLAMVMEERGYFEDALELEDRSLELRELILGSDHWHVALSLTTIGNILTSTHRPREALPLLERAEQIAVDTWGDGYTDLYWIRWNTALALSELGEHDRASELLNAVFQGIESHELEQIMAAPLRVQWVVARNAGRFEDGLRAAEDALAMAQGDDWSDLERAEVQLRRAMSHADLGDDESAADDFDTALTVILAEADRLTDTVLVGEARYAAVLASLGRSDDVAARWVPLLDRLRAQVEVDEPRPRDQLRLARWLVDCPAASLRQPSEAVLIMQDALEQFESGHPEFMNVLARAMHVQGRTAEAEATIEHAIQALNENDERRSWLMERFASWRGTGG